MTKPNTNPYFNQPPIESTHAVYVHVPFCVHRCGYCDFTVIAGRDDLVPAYLDALECEYQLWLGGARPRVQTVFIGGGTPTQLPPCQLANFFKNLHSRFEFASELEFSVEANPANLSAEVADILVDFGVNRVSLGIQSFDDETLKTLERDHDRPQIAMAINHLQQAGIKNFSLDLIFGVPGQSLANWDETLNEALAHEPQHLSTYGLTFEKGTAFWSRRQKGRLQQLDEESERAMYQSAISRLSAAGYRQYELSNFARMGAECQHNLNYWRGGNYYAFGPGAARHHQGVRETNHRSVFTWLKKLQTGQSPVMDREVLTPVEQADERLMLGLRMTEGADLNAIQQATGCDMENLRSSEILRLQQLGLLEFVRTSNQVAGSAAQRRLRLTTEGRFVADSIILELLD